MAKKTLPPISESTQFLVNKIRENLLSISDEISEEVKWNSPSFYYNGEMKPFNPREYKRDIVVLNIREERILLVFPTGAKIPDDNGFLEGNFADGRKMVTIRSIEELESKQKLLQRSIVDWINLVEK